MKINEYIKSCKWSDIKAQVFSLNSNLKSMLNKPQFNDMRVYEVTYPYGESLLNNGSLKLPDDTGRARSISNKSFVSILDDLNYIKDFFLPLSFVLSGDIEIYFDNGVNKSPLKLYSAGAYLGVLGFIDRSLHSFLPNAWRVSAGLNNYLSSKKLKKIFLNTSNNSAKIIYFSSDWTAESEALSELNINMAASIEKRGSFWRQALTWDIFFSKLANQQVLSLATLNTLKQIIYIATGNFPGWAPIDKKASIKDNANHIMVPTYLSAENTVVAYSLAYPTALSEVSTKNSLSIQSELFEVLKHWDQIINKTDMRNILSGSDIEKIKQENFMLSHTKRDFMNKYANKYKSFSNMYDEFYAGLILIR